MTDHLPILLVIIPMVIAPAIVVINRSSVSRLGSLAGLWVITAIAGYLLMQTAGGNRLRYEIGGWKPPYGIEYVIDPFSAFVSIIVAGVAAIVLTGASQSVTMQIPKSKHTLFYATYLLCTAGLLGMCVTGDLFNVFVFLEISSLSSYALIALGHSRRAALAALQYLIVGTIGATFFLIGIGLLYQMTGTLNMADLADRLPIETGSRTLLVAFAMMTVGLAIKMAVFPVHTWLPNAYSHAPESVTAFMAATSTKVSVYAFIRLTYTIFSGEFAFEILPLDSELMLLALMGVYVASTGAIFQKDIKRVLAYSSIAQVGYMILGISLNRPEGLAAGIAHMMNHGLIKGGLFMAVMAMSLRLGSTRMDDLRGIGRTMPWTAMAMTIGLLGLIGVPLTAGFVTKWMLLTTTLQINAPIIAGLLLVASLLAVIYSWRIVETMFFAEPSARAAAATEAPPVMLGCTWLMIALVIVAGVYPMPAVWATEAAEFLLGQGR